MAVVSSEENERWIEEFSFMVESVAVPRIKGIPSVTNRRRGAR